MQTAGAGNAATLAAFCVCGSILLARLLVRSAGLKQMQAHWKNNKSHDLGSAFGFDIGGTLSKVVYFYRTETGTPKNEQGGRIRRTASYLSAVEQMKDFLLSQVFYGATGTRDTGLRVKSDKLQGELHFIRLKQSG